VHDDNREHLISGDEKDGTWCKLIKVQQTPLVSGKLVVYTHGLEQETVVVPAKGTKPGPIKLEEGSAPAPSGQEWSEAALYFSIDGDHVVAAQSQALRISRLEAFLNWILRHKTKLVPDDQYLELEALTRSEAAKVLKATEAKSITLGRVIDFTPAKEGPSVISQQTTVRLSSAQNLIKALLDVANLSNSIPPDLFSGGRIQTDITFHWTKKTGGEKPKQTMDGLKKLALQQMDADDSFKVSIDTPRGKLGKKDLTLSKDVRIDAPDGKLPATVVYQHLRDFLKDLHLNKEIAP
jgi:hypothetical protein